MVISKKRPTAAAAQKPSNVNAAIRAGAPRSGMLSVPAHAPLLLHVRGRV